MAKTAQTINTTFKLRRGTADEWTIANPILAEGEPGFEKDTNKLKIGDGTSAWEELDYMAGSTDFVREDQFIEIFSTDLELNDNLGQNLFACIPVSNNLPINLIDFDDELYIEVKGIKYPLNHILAEDEFHMYVYNTDESLVKSKEEDILLVIEIDTEEDDETMVLASDIDLDGETVKFLHLDKDSRLATIGDVKEILGQNPLESKIVDKFVASSDSVAVDDGFYNWQTDNFNEDLLNQEYVLIAKFQNTNLEFPLTYTIYKEAKNDLLIYNYTYNVDPTIFEDDINFDNITPLNPNEPIILFAMMTERDNELSCYLMTDIDIEDETITLIGYPKYNPNEYITFNKLKELINGKKDQKILWSYDFSGTQEELDQESGLYKYIVNTPENPNLPTSNLYISVEDRMYPLKNFIPGYTTSSIIFSAAYNITRFGVEDSDKSVLIMTVEKRIGDSLDVIGGASNIQYRITILSSYDSYDFKRDPIKIIQINKTESILPKTHYEFEFYINSDDGVQFDCETPKEGTFATISATIVETKNILGVFNIVVSDELPITVVANNYTITKEEITFFGLVTLNDIDYMCKVILDEEDTATVEMKSL